MKKSIIKVHGITYRERATLDSDSDLTFEEQKIPSHAIGEPSTFIMVVTVAGIASLAAYFLKKNSFEDFEEEIEITNPDGSTTKKKVKWRKKSSEAPKADVIQAIVSVINLVIPNTINIDKKDE